MIHIIEKFMEEMPSDKAKEVLMLIFEKKYHAALETVKMEIANPTETFNKGFDDITETEHPKRYMNKNGIEAITIIDICTNDLKGGMAVCIGNAVKYLTRLGKKDDAAQEWKKIKWYLERSLIY